MCEPWLESLKVQLLLTEAKEGESAEEKAEQQEKRHEYVQALIQGTDEEKAAKYENLMNIWNLHQARDGRAEIYGLNAKEIKELAVKNEKTLVKELIELRG